MIVKTRLKIIICPSQFQNSTKSVFSINWYVCVFQSDFSNSKWHKKYSNDSPTSKKIEIQDSLAGEQFLLSFQGKWNDVAVKKLMKALRKTDCLKPHALNCRILPRTFGCIIKELSISRKQKRFLLRFVLSTHHLVIVNFANWPYHAVHHDNCGTVQTSPASLFLWINDVSGLKIDVAT